MAPIWLDILDQTVRVCAAHGRTDLAQRLQQRRSQLLDATVRVLVIGEPKQGKSQLVNALINAPVCPVGDGLTTAIPTAVHHAETPTAALVRRGAGRTPVPVAELADRISAGPTSATGSVHAEVGVPRGLLAPGMVLVDTPGLDGDRPAHGSSPVASLAGADVVVMVSDATRELSVAEVDRLRRVIRQHPHVVVALTKIDIVPHWRLVAERNRQQLASAGVPATLFPVSAALRLQAARTNDRAVNAESGFPDLIARLVGYRSAKRDVLAPATARLLVGAVIEQLAAPLRAGLASTGASEPLARLHEAQRALDELRRCSTRWQNTLADETADLMSDLEYDLRDRTRQILREVDEAFDAADPLHRWSAYQSWLDRVLTDAAEANFAWLVQRCDWIAGQLADHFVQYGADTRPEWKAARPAALRGQAAVIEPPHIERYTPVQKVFTGLRGSYLGVLIVGLASTLAGLPLINPFSVGAGVLFAGKSIRDESKSQLKRRQAAAKAASQRYVDDFFLRLNKECKDSVRWVQHLLRDHYAGLAEQIHDSIVHSLRTAKQAADADAVQRDRRHRELQQQLRQLAALSERAQALTAVRATPAVAGPGPAA